MKNTGSAEDHCVNVNWNWNPELRFVKKVHLPPSVPITSPVPTVAISSWSTIVGWAIEEIHGWIVQG